MQWVMGTIRLIGPGSCIAADVRREIFELCAKSPNYLLVVSAGNDSVFEGGIGSEMALLDGEIQSLRHGEINDRSMVLLVPKQLLASTHQKKLRGPVQVPANSGIGRILLSMVIEICGVCPEREKSQLSFLERPVASMLSALLGKDLGSRATSHRRSTLDHAKKCIDDRLTEAELSPGEVAESLGISVRNLHKVFGETDDTFGAYVRRKRIERICLDLSDPRFKGTITECALYWGFNSSSHFSRVFRQLKGCTARQFLKNMETVSE